MSKMPQPFDNPKTYKNHSGVDYAQPTYAVIKASANGTVTLSGWLNDRAGWSTIVAYDDCVVLYCHQPNMPPVKFGDKVKLNTTIGEVGNSGHSTGPHLHMEIMVGEGAHTYDGIWNYFDKNSVIGQGSSSGTGSSNNNSGKPNNNDEEEMNIVLYLYVPTNDLLLVDHMNKTIRQLGSKNTALRDYYSHRHYEKVADKGNKEGLPDWAALTKGYTYI